MEFAGEGTLFPIMACDTKLTDTNAHTVENTVHTAGRSVIGDSLDTSALAATNSN